MANTAAEIGESTPCRMVWLLTGDGTVAGPTIANATILAAMSDGPLKTLWSTAYADQAAMRAALFATRGRIAVTYRTTPVQTTAEQGLVVVDVDTDATSPTLPEINIGMSDTTGQIAYLTLEYVKDVP